MVIKLLKIGFAIFTAAMGCSLSIKMEHAHRYKNLLIKKKLIHIRLNIVRKRWKDSYLMKKIFKPQIATLSKTAFIFLNSWIC